jgi:hypothetical protein
MKEILAGTESCVERKPLVLGRTQFIQDQNV